MQQSAFLHFLFFARHLIILLFCWPMAAAIAAASDDKAAATIQSHVFNNKSSHSLGTTTRTTTNSPPSSIFRRHHHNGGDESSSSIYFVPSLLQQIHRLSVEFSSSDGQEHQFSAHFRNIRKISNFIGARNPVFIPGTSKILFDSNHIFNGAKGCDQFYLLDSEESTAAAAVYHPERISPSGQAHFRDARFAVVVNPSSATTNLPGAFPLPIIFSSTINENVMTDNNCGSKNRQQNCDYEERIAGFLHNYCSHRVKTYGHPICEWFSRESDHPWDEVYPHLEDTADIYAGSLAIGAMGHVGMDLGRRLTDQWGFDGHPVVSSSNGRIYYISMRSGEGNAQIWSMNVRDGSEKKQLTSSSGWKLRPSLSQNQKWLIFECIPPFEKNDTVYREFINRNMVNRGHSRICILELPDDHKGLGNNAAERQLKFTAKRVQNQQQQVDWNNKSGGMLVDVDALYQFTAPVFFPPSNSASSATVAGSGRREKDGAAVEATEEKILFSARDARLLGKGNTALYMANIDGTELERITSYGYRNDNPVVVDWTGPRRIAWVRDDPESGMHSWMSFLYIADWIPLPNIEKQRMMVDEASPKVLANYSFLSGIKQITSVEADDSIAVRPKFDIGGESIIYEWKKYSDVYNGNEIGEQSQLRRIFFPQANFLNGSNGFMQEKDEEDALPTRQHAISDNSRFEWASNVAMLGGPLSGFGADGGRLAFGAPFLLYATTIISSRTNGSVNYGCETTQKFTNISSSCGAFFTQLLLNRDGNTFLPTDFKLLHSGSDIYKFNAFGHVAYPLADGKGFDGEPAVFVSDQNNCPMAYTSSTKGGRQEDGGAGMDDDGADDNDDLDLWTLNACEGNMYRATAGNNKQWRPKMHKLMTRMGYDGEAAYSPDGGAKIVFTAEIVRNNSKRRELLKCGLVNMSHSEIFLLNANGTGLKQVTRLGAHSFAPTFVPGHGDRFIVFSSNYGTKNDNNDENGHSMSSAIFIKDQIGGRLERLISNENGYDAFADLIPMVNTERSTTKSPIPRPSHYKVAWSSNRHNKEGGGGGGINIWTGMLDISPFL